MKLAAALVVAAALVLPAGQAAERKTLAPVLGFDVAKSGVSRLAWFDPLTLSTMRGRKAPIGRYTGSWSFSPDRSALAIAAAQTTGSERQPLLKLRFVNARGMRVLGEISLGDPRVDSVSWLLSGRLLAVIRWRFPIDRGRRSGPPGAGAERAPPDFTLERRASAGRPRVAARKRRLVRARDGGRR
jgi:hypothetical protein